MLRPQRERARVRLARRQARIALHDSRLQVPRLVGSRSAKHGGEESDEAQGGGARERRDPRATRGLGVDGDRLAKEAKAVRGRRTTVASRRPLPWEKTTNANRSMRTALRFARLMLEHSRVGLTVVEIAEELDISNRFAHRLVRAAEFAGWPLVRDDEFRWKLAR